MHKLSYYLSTVHLMISITICWGISTAIDSEASMIWIVLFALDFPVSYGYILLADIAQVIGVSDIVFEELFGPNFSDFYNVVLPTFYFVIVGTVWWFFLPRLVARLVEILKFYLTRK